jgi:polyribonucleotide nucleotidyltransferase
VKGIAFDPEIGRVFEGTVMKVLEAGAFINYLPGKDGFVHISEIADERVENIHDHLKEGNKVKIKFIGMDPVKGKAKFSMKLSFDHANAPARESSNRDRGDKADKGDRVERSDRGDKGDKKPFTKDKPHVGEKRKDRDEEAQPARRRKNDNPSESNGPVSERKYFS